ncbi:MAG: hypothetical protein AAFZ63_06805 [Bacteroidota bacterium]
MRALSLILTTVFFFTAGSFCLKAIHSPLQPSTEILSPMEAYLGLDNGLAGFEKEIIAELREEPKRAEAYFVSIIKDGLPKEARAAAEEDYAQFFAYRQGFLANKERSITVVEGKAEKGWAIPRMGEREYVENRIKKLERNTRARAMEGLTVLERDSALEFLEELSNNKRFELWEYAVELLEQK